MGKLVDNLEHNADFGYVNLTTKKNEEVHLSIQVSQKQDWLNKTWIVTIRNHPTRDPWHLNWTKTTRSKWSIFTRAIVSWMVACSIHLGFQILLSFGKMSNISCQYPHPIVVLFHMVSLPSLPHAASFIEQQQMHKS